MFVLSELTNILFVHRTIPKSSRSFKLREMVMPEGADGTACCYLEADTDQ